jgi:hypothetical protein
MRDLWDPIMKMVSRNTPKGQKGQQMSTAEMAAIMKGLPHCIHAQFLTHEGFLWSSLRPSDLVIPADDLALKHGGAIGGRWKVLFILDAYPDEAKPPDFSGLVRRRPYQRRTYINARNESSDWAAVTLGWDYSVNDFQSREPAGAGECRRPSGRNRRGLADLHRTRTGLR